MQPFALRHLCAAPQLCAPALWAKHHGRPCTLGDPDSVIEAGISARYRVNSESGDRDGDEAQEQEPGLLFKLD